MAMSLNESFERSCRLCAKEQEVTIMIFSAEAEAMLLQNKLNKYLLIEVDENDKLPKNICITCCTKLQTVCDFIDSARKAQEMLLDRSILLDTIISDSCVNMNFSPNIKLEPHQYLDEESQSTEMEVSVDPMMVLQNSEGIHSPVPNDNQNVSVEDVTYLHGLENENVTIKLIRRSEPNNGDTSEQSNDAKKKNDCNGKPFPCVICKRSFLTELALKNHSWSHLNEDKNNKQFNCSTCSETFDYKCALIAHIKQHRSSGTCKICGRTFRSEENLALHMESHLTPHKGFMCKVCGRAYNNHSNLKTHSITHSNERPYHCHLCMKSFKRNQDLKFHINQHTGAKPYKCPFCDKSFASSGNCYSHRSRMHPGKRTEPKGGRGRRRVVTVSRENQAKPRAIAPKVPVTVKGIYKYKCHFCEHSFIKKDNFTYHMYQHTGEKPYQCSLCPVTFVTRRGLQLHHDKEHPAQKRPLGLLTKNVLLK